MVSDKEYEKLKNQYHICVARIKNLEEQEKTKKAQWEDRETYFKLIETLSRELCESILAKDSNEMVLGRDYSWSSIPVDELIRKAQKVFSWYVDSRKDLMGKLMDQLETRRVTIEKLNEEKAEFERKISKMAVAPGNIITQEQLDSATESEKNEAIKNMPGNVKAAAQSNRINVVIADEYDSFEEVERDVYQKNADKIEATKITSKSIPHVLNNTQKQTKKDAKENAGVHISAVTEIEAKMTPIAWTVLSIIGKQGFSRISEIEDAFFKLDTITTSSKMRMTIKSMVIMEVLREEKVKTPYTGVFLVYQLTTLGSKLFKLKFGESAIPSEMDIIMAEHDNCIHGYGIKFVSEAIRKNGTFQTVEDKNRKHPIKIKDGVSYIPDIVCTDEADVKTYIEYECGNHTQSDFNAKCNKMCAITNTLNFIVPNKDTADKIVRQVDNWVTNKGQKTLSNIVVRITGAMQISDRNLKDNKDWKYVYILKKKKEPIQNF